VSFTVITLCAASQRVMSKVSLYESVTKSFRTESVTKYTLTFRITRTEATQRAMAEKLTRMTHKIAIQLHLVAEGSTICSSRSRRPVRKLLDTPWYFIIDSVRKLLDTPSYMLNKYTSLNKFRIITKISSASGYNWWIWPTSLHDVTTEKTTT
jgi:hypothetical protein